jgi:hypothetical protein
MPRVTTGTTWKGILTKTWDKKDRDEPADFQGFLEGNRGKKVTHEDWLAFQVELKAKRKDC